MIYFNKEEIIKWINSAKPEYIYRRFTQRFSTRKLDHSQTSINTAV